MSHGHHHHGHHHHGHHHHHHGHHTHVTGVPIPFVSQGVPMSIPATVVTHDHHHHHGHHGHHDHHAVDCCVLL